VTQATLNEALDKLEYDDDDDDEVSMMKEANDELSTFHKIKFSAWTICPQFSRSATPIEDGGQGEEDLSQ